MVLRCRQAAAWAHMRRLQVCCSQMEILSFDQCILDAPHFATYPGSGVLPPVEQHGMLFTH